MKGEESFLAGLHDATDCEAMLNMVGAGAKIGVIGERGTPVGTDAAAGINNEVVNPLRLMGTNPPSGCDTTTCIDVGIAWTKEEIWSTGAVKMTVRVTYC